MLFYGKEKKSVNAGDFCKDFFNKVSEISPHLNLGWEIIDSIKNSKKEVHSDKDA